MNISEDEFLSWVPVKNNGDSSTTPFLVIWNFLISETTVQFIKINLYGFLIQVLFLPYVGLFIYYLLTYGIPIVLKKYHTIKCNWNEGYSKINVGNVKEKIYSWWYWTAKLWFGYNVVGLENCPINEPLLFVSYHGSIPAHLPATLATVTKFRQRRLYCLVNTMHFQGVKSFCDLVDIEEWDKEECVQHLKDGYDVIICPGGREEKQQSNENYRVIWPSEQEFGDVIKETKATVVPVFCRNIQEAFWIPFYFRPFLQGKLAPDNSCLIIIGGGLPINLSVLFGKSITFDENLTSRETEEKIKNALQQLVDANQRIPGSKLHAVLDRLRTVTCDTNIDYEANQDQTNRSDSSEFSIV